MEIIRQVKGINTCFELRVGQGEVREAYTLEMLAGNHFAFLPELTVEWVDGERRLIYKADGMVGLVRKWGASGPGWQDVQDLLVNLADCIRELQDYLLPAEGILLSSAYLLYDETERRIRFLYAPGRSAFFSESMKYLMEEIMPRFSHANETEIVRFYDLYERFLSGSFTPEMLLQLTDTWRRPASDPVQTDRAGMRTVIADEGVLQTRTGKQKPLDLSDPNTEKDYKTDTKPKLGKVNGADSRGGWIFYALGGLLILVSVGAYLLFGIGSLRISALLGAAYVLFLLCRLILRDRDYAELTAEGVQKVAQVYGGQTAVPVYENRTVHTDCTALVPATSILRNSIRQLVPVETGIRAPLYVSEGYCRIGRNEGENEYCIAAPSISRNHARLECCGSVVTLRDLGSTNGTYINHVRITDSAARELHYGDVVSFAEEEYYVV
ncbi:MAG: FHA domain-containing protein [Eubacterium sp.]|nr:FHA domain-containing protein [Eubacterium sp.]